MTRNMYTHYIMHPVYCNIKIYNCNTSYTMTTWVGELTNQTPVVHLADAIIIEYTKTVMNMLTPTLPWRCSDAHIIYMRTDSFLQ